MPKTPKSRKAARSPSRKLPRKPAVIPEAHKKEIHTQAAFLNPEFMLGRDGRAVRILAEFLSPEHRFERLKIEDTLVFFGSARALSKRTAAANLRAARKAAGTGPKTEAVLKAERDVLVSRYYEECYQLSKKLALWSEALGYHYAFCSGGGPGIMEAANKGAQAGGAPSVGLNILLPFEQSANRYIDPDLNFEFRYFFMRKFWFAYMAKAIIMFPGGFGTIDEMMEVLTLVQTQRITKKMAVVLYGKEYWSRVVDFRYLAEMGMIHASDLDLFHICETVDEAFAFITQSLVKNRKPSRRTP
jgi:uncharacterized protein (TIGR00730 family)